MSIKTEVNAEKIIDASEIPLQPSLDKITVNVNNLPYATESPNNLPVITEDELLAELDKFEKEDLARKTARARMTDAQYNAISMARKKNPPTAWRILSDWWNSHEDWPRRGHKSLSEAFAKETQQREI